LEWLLFQKSVSTKTKAFLLRKAFLFY